MDNSKNIVKSKTIWGLLIAMLPLVLSVFGVNLSAETMGAVSELGVQVIQLAGLGFAFYGRVVAKDPVKILPK